MSHIHRIRKKLEQNPKKPEYIHNVYGIGYRFGDKMVSADAEDIPQKKCFSFPVIQGKDVYLTSLTE